MCWTRARAAAWVAVVVVLCGVAAASNCTVANDCATAPGTPYCYGGRCVQCNPLGLVPACDCPATDYCITDPTDPEVGGCRQYETAALGAPCSMRLKGKGMDLVQGVNDTLFCGLVRFDSQFQARHVEWEGACVQGSCAVCSIAPLTMLPLSICSDGRSCTRDGTIGDIPMGIFAWSMVSANPYLATMYTTALVICTTCLFVMPCVVYQLLPVLRSL